MPLAFLPPDIQVLPLPPEEPGELLPLRQVEALVRELFDLSPPSKAARQMLRPPLPLTLSEVMRQYEAGAGA